MQGVSSNPWVIGGAVLLFMVILGWFLKRNWPKAILFAVVTPMVFGSLWFVFWIVTAPVLALVVPAIEDLPGPLPFILNPATIGTAIFFVLYCRSARDSADLPDTGAIGTHGVSGDAKNPFQRRRIK